MYSNVWAFFYVYIFIKVERLIMASFKGGIVFSNVVGMVLRNKGIECEVHLALPGKGRRGIF